MRSSTIEIPGGVRKEHEVARTPDSDLGPHKSSRATNPM